MLIEFTVGNYFSIKDRKTLSLESTAIKEFPENVVDRGRVRILRGAVIYGANSSGKTNLIRAITTMSRFVAQSAKSNSIDEIEVMPFLLSTSTENQASYFEMIFLLDDTVYRYGFEVDNKIVHTEWLYHRQGSIEKNLFIRDKDKIEISAEFEEGKGVEEKTRDNALFLSVVDQFNGKISKLILEWFGNQFIFSGLHHEKEKSMSLFLLKRKEYKDWITDFLIPLNLGFKDFGFSEESEKVVTYHSKYDDLGNLVSDRLEFDLLKQESAGTNKLYDMAGRLIIGLRLGGLTIIDELDAKLHPILTMTIVKLFNSQNPASNAQLIFATHDTNLLNDCFRRDQIYFTEKDSFGATDLYSLVEYKEPDGTKVRKDRSFEKDYIAGRYGAIPFVGDFSKIISNGESGKD
jgi:uncharacterized protein